MRIHIFNPENDMALASGSPGYTPPANIRAYRKNNWQLPLQWADDEDLVWDGESCLAPFFTDPATSPEICPWGWSPALVHELTLAGVPRSNLPTKEYLHRLRELSSRETTVPIQTELGISSKVCRSLEDIESLIKAWGEIIMKSPWSSSGKGLMQTDNPNWQGWVKRIIRLQGCVIAEKLVDKKQDFAMEFWMRDGKASYVGLNIFHTDGHGHFLDNIIGSQEKNAESIASMLKIPKKLETVREWFIGKLPQIARWYTGPIGVDMLVTTKGTLHPCIEINWRMTMGMAGILTQINSGIRK
ncbi:MAG: hypothetical protein IKU79_02045 [Bacteroidaceae bacterium]|nr:hypothetical protein [Bacteroidaceae bacterium]